MSFDQFYEIRMKALAGGRQDVECTNNPQNNDPYTPTRVTLPPDVSSPYYKDRDIWRHYPNLYDFKRASIFNIPPAVLCPYNQPQPHTMPDYLGAQDFRRSALISKRKC